MAVLRYLGWKDFSQNFLDLVKKENIDVEFVQPGDKDCPIGLP
jgi:hypothetical protein